MEDLNLPQQVTWVLTLDKLQALIVEWWEAVKIMKRSSIIVLILFIAVVSFFIFINTGKVSGIPLDMYKSPTCGCCVGHASNLETKGFDVNVIPTSNMNSLKSMHNIPANMQSCHTSLVEGYFVEGHVPMEAIDKLLLERPNIDGIALPGMPAGSPGMPGVKNKEWIIYSLKDGNYEEFMRI